MRDFFDPSAEELVVVLVERSTMRKAEHLIESCEICKLEGAETPFDNFLDRVNGAKGFGGRLALLISVLLCCSASLSAQENHVIEISGGIAGLHTMTDSTLRVLSTSSSPPQITVDGFLTGWSATAATNVYHNVFVVGDIGSHYTGGYWQNGIQVGPPYCFGGPCGPNYYIPSVRTRTYLFGPRFSFA